MSERISEVDRAGYRVRLDADPAGGRPGVTIYDAGSGQLVNRWIPPKMPTTSLTVATTWTIGPGPGDAPALGGALAPTGPGDAPTLGGRLDPATAPIVNERLAKAVAEASRPHFDELRWWVLAPHDVEAASVDTPQMFRLAAAWWPPVADFVSASDAVRGRQLVHAIEVDLVVPMGERGFARRSYLRSSAGVWKCIGLEWLRGLRTWSPIVGRTVLPGGGRVTFTHSAAVLP